MMIACRFSRSRSLYLSISTSLCSTLSRFLSVCSAIFFTYVYQSVNHTQFLCIYVRTSLSLSKLCVTSPPFLSLALSLAPPSTLRPIILLSSLPPPPSSLHPLIHLSQFPLHPSPCLQGARAGERGVKYCPRVTRQLTHDTDKLSRATIIHVLFLSLSLLFLRFFTRLKFLLDECVWSYM